MTPPITLAEVLDRLHALRKHALDGVGGGGRPSEASMRVVQAVVMGLASAGVPMPTVVRPDGDGGMLLRWAVPDVEVGIGALGVLATLVDGDGESESLQARTPAELGAAVAERVGELVGASTPPRAA